MLCATMHGKFRELTRLCASVGRYFGSCMVLCCLYGAGFQEMIRLCVSVG